MSIAGEDDHGCPKCGLSAFAASGPGYPARSMRVDKCLPPVGHMQETRTEVYAGCLFLWRKQNPLIKL